MLGNSRESDIWLLIVVRNPTAYMKSSSNPDVEAYRLGLSFQRSSTCASHFALSMSSCDFRPQKCPEESCRGATPPSNNSSSIPSIIGIMNRRRKLLQSDIHASLYRKSMPGSTESAKHHGHVGRYLLLVLLACVFALIVRHRSQRTTRKIVSL